MNPIDCLCILLFFMFLANKSWGKLFMAWGRNASTAVNARGGFGLLENISTLLASEHSPFSLWWRADALHAFGSRLQGALPWSRAWATAHPEMAWEWWPAEVGVWASLVLVHVPCQPSLDGLPWGCPLNRWPALRLDPGFWLVRWDSGAVPLN